MSKLLAYLDAHIDHPSAETKLVREKSVRLPKACTCTNTKVFDSRRDPNGVRRRRECLDCGRKWTSLEVEVDEGHPHVSTLLRLQDKMRAEMMSEMLGKLHKLLDEAFRAEEVTREPLAITPPEKFEKISKKIRMAEYPFAEMKPGEVFTTNREVKTVSTAASMFKRRHQPTWKFVVRKTPEGTKCWRAK